MSYDWEKWQQLHKGLNSSNRRRMRQTIIQSVNSKKEKIMTDQGTPAAPASETTEKPKKNRTLMIIGIVAAALVVCCILLFAITQLLPESDETTTPIAQVTEEEAIKPSEEPVEPEEPTETLQPTNTPEPTNTPQPTNTPTPEPSPTPVPDPVVYEGSGDSIVDIADTMELFGGFAVAHIVGNQGSRHFSVTSLDVNNEWVELLVNTTEPYDGQVPVDFLEGEQSVRLEISASGDWTVTLIPIDENYTYLNTISVPGTYQGNGFDVIFLVGDTPDTAHIIGNAGGRHFSVTGYGGGWDLLVNTTDPYDGTVIVNSKTLTLEITATGEWSIEITSR